MNEQPNCLFAALGVFKGFPYVAATGAMLGFPTKGLELIGKASRPYVNPRVAEDVRDSIGMPLKLAECRSVVADTKRSEPILAASVAENG